MSKIKIITDSTGDLPREIAEKYNITILPMTTSFSGRDYLDGIDLKAADFYELLAKCSELPHTSQHSPLNLIQTYQQAMADGSTVVAIHLSSGLSGTVQNAYLAQEMMEKEERQRLHIFDSLTASSGQGLLAVRAAELAQNGESAERIIEELNQMRSRLYNFFVVDTLKYLLKGGRINRVQATVGSLLEIKPLLEIDGQGRINQFDKARGSKAALRRLTSTIEEYGADLANQRVAVSHAVSLDEARMIEEIFMEKYQVKEVIIGEIGAVVGTHVGAGTKAIFFQGEAHV